MAALLYKGFLMIAMAFFDKGKAQWMSIVDLSWRSDAHRRSYVISDSSKSFQTKTEAEIFGVEIGKAWVDERCKALIHQRPDRTSNSD